MKEIEHERRDWMIVFVILLFGLLCVILAGGWALRFSPSWHLDTNMGSELDPNSDYLTRPSGILEAIDSAIQTQPVWMGLFLTEGAAIPTRVRMTSTPAPFATSTSLAPTTTKYSTGTPTNTLIYLPPSRTATSNPGFTKTPPATGTVTGTPNSQTTSTSTSTVTATGTPTVTGTATGTSTATGTATGTATATATPTNPPPFADLQITITDNATAYDSNTTSIQYTVVVLNSSASPSGVTGALVSSALSANLTNVTWTCVASGSAVCSDGAGTFADTVNLAVGSSITYNVNAPVSTANGNIVSTVSVAPPAGITDTDTTNNSATDTDTLITADTPPNTIGTDPDGKPYKLRSGNALTLNINLIANGDSAWDVVYYEYPGGSGIVLDWVTIEISDGRNWYPIFNWGDNIADTNSNMDFNKLPLPSIPPYPPPEEPDQRDIPATSLYVSPNGYATGIAIDIDSIVPPGNYSYIRFYAPPGDVDNGMEIDSIQVLP